jgi:hypothetical protein
MKPSQNQSVLDWRELITPVGIYVQSDDTFTPMGGIVPDWALEQTVASLIQPHVFNRRGSDQTGSAEGIIVRHTHVMYCRPTCTKQNTERVLITEANQVRWTDSAGLDRRARVVEFADEGGQGDHFKVLLYEIKPVGD